MKTVTTSIKHTTVEDHDNVQHMARETLRLQFVNFEFVKRMDLELCSNQARKGNWPDWHPNLNESESELKHCVVKLIDALQAIEHDPKQISEFCADVANIVMKIDEEHGKK